MHPDEVTGLLANTLHRFARRTDNSIGRLRQYTQSPAPFFIPPPDALPTVHRQPKRSPPGFTLEHWSYSSQHTPLDAVMQQLSASTYAANQTVWVRVVRPNHAVRARLIYVHGWIQPETVAEELFFLTLMAQILNVEVYHLQPPYHGRRTPNVARFGGELLWSADLVRSLESLRQGALDLQTLISILQSDGDQPIGIAGVSLGGFFSLLLSCLDERIAFSIPMIAHMDLAALTRDAPVLGRMRRELNARGYRISDLQNLLTTLGWYDLSPAISPDRIYPHAGNNDRFFPASTVKKQFDSFGIPKIEWYRATHMTFIPQIPLALRKTGPFLDRLFGG